MNKTLKLLGFGLCLILLLLVDASVVAMPGIGFVGEAAAIVGAPLTPVSAAGVARRTTRRTVVVASTAAATTTAAATATQPAPAQPTPPPPAQAQTGAPPVGTMVPELPSGCVSSPKNGIEYYNCGGVYYRPAFQGNNLVYVVQSP
ncbi:MAG: hypothetical protein R6V84_00075 [Desulfobacterales bacterium]|jgi:hypothetical protein